ncbi:hypothetical protein L4F31_19205 [Vibrio paracholerae]|nr:hypothetical protein [Vibrio paracholerae]MCO7017742.1 hypothetical protein [Vibrio paracholerae]MCO7025292.1 hypothetical protein [Vibrio paracholerae]MCO7048184.1 hypothetical protein [Vibrio paracholerae]
MPNEAAMCLVL